METFVSRRPRHWWVFLIRGLLFVALGIYMVAVPGVTYAALGFIFGLIILVAGVSELLHSVQDKDAYNRGWHIFIGLIDLILGIVLVGHIAASATILRIIVGIWFLFGGFSILSISGLLGRHWITTLGGIIILLLAILILFDPVFGAITIVFWTAFAFVMNGIFNIILSARLRQLER